MIAATLYADCSACRIGGRQVRATHADGYGREYVWCDQHAASFDPPLTTTQQAQGGTVALTIVVLPCAVTRRPDWPLGRLTEIGGY